MSMTGNTCAKGLALTLRIVAGLCLLSACATHLAALQHHSRAEFQERHPPQ